MTCSSIDDARNKPDFWVTLLRRTGRQLQDPEIVSSILSAQERERVLLSQVDLGDEAHFLLLCFGAHRIWTIGVTTKHSSSDGIGRKRTYAVLEWETSRSLRGVDLAPEIGWKTILPQHLLDAVVHPLKPPNVRMALLRFAPKAGDTIDLDGLDALGALRVLDHLLRSAAEPSDALALRRAFKYALTMRDKVRRCFSRRLDLWTGDPIRELGA